MSTLQLDANALVKAGLNEDRVRLHQMRLVDALQGKVKTHIPVVDACTLENGGLVAWETAVQSTKHLLRNDKPSPDSNASLLAWQTQKVLTCIPAAGAASRFLGELNKYCLEIEKLHPELKALANDFLEKGKRNKVSSDFKSVLASAFKTLAVSGKFKELCNSTLNASIVNDTRPIVSLYEFISKKIGALESTRGTAEGNVENKPLLAYCVAKVVIRSFGSQPKAFVPTTRESDTFLELKVWEQLQLFPSRANAVVAGSQLTNDFRRELSKACTKFKIKPKAMNWEVLEQGRDLCTLRFNTDGSLYRNENGDYSWVSAGHGELVHVFDTFAAHHKEAECLHIRNIDNVIGASEERREELSTLAAYFRVLRESLVVFRKSVADILKKPNARASVKIKDKECLKAYRTLINAHGFGPDSVKFEMMATSAAAELSAADVYRTLGSIFHWPSLPKEKITGLQLWERIFANLLRPVSVMGVVKKQNGDVGGGPVLARLDDGTVIKICLEMPHANESDSNKFFAEGGKSTHFNPVLVFFELKFCEDHDAQHFPVSRANFNRLFDDRFWLLTQRSVAGRPVVYHETVLYELIGNSAQTNLVFVEVPRTLFHPHKTIFESLGQDRKSYGFEVLGAKVATAS